MFRGTHGTNQNFIARPGNADIDSTGCEDEPFPQTLNQLVTSAQLEYIDEGRNIGEHKKLRVSVSGSIRNQVLMVRALSVPNNKRSPQNLFTLSLQIILCQRLAIEPKDTPPRSLKSEPLITRKMPDPLEMAQDLRTAMGEHRHVFLAQPAVKLTQFLEASLGPVTKNRASSLVA